MKKMIIRERFRKTVGIGLVLILTAGLFPTGLLAAEVPEAAAEQPAAEQPAAEQPAAEQPTAEQPAAEQPVTEETPSENAGEAVSEDAAKEAVEGSLSGDEIISESEDGILKETGSEDEEPAGEGYNVTGGEVFFITSEGKITGSKNINAGASVVIPSTLGGADVKVIGEGAFQEKDLSSISLPKSVESIEDYAFRYDEFLSEISIGGKPFDPNDYGTVKVGNLAFTDTLLVRPDFSPAYKTGQWYQKLTEIKPTGNYLDDLFAVAGSQMGYHEGNYLNEQDGSNTKGRGDYSEMTYWWGERGEMWCGEFAGWCIAMASIPEEIFSSKYTTDPSYKWEQTTYAGGSGCTLKKEMLSFLGMTAEVMSSLWSLPHSPEAWLRLSV